jgi:hypothetical protein
MATVMAECLEKILAEDGIVCSDSVPAGVQQDALRFLKLVLEATGEGGPDNPPASLNAYVIASGALIQSSPEATRTRDEIDVQLKRYEALLEKLGTPGRLDGEDQALANSLRSFFLRLKEDGESEAYTKAVYLEGVPTGFPFR